MAMKDITKVPPHNNDAERALLGALLLRPEIVHEIAESTRPTTFYHDRHGIIYEVIMELFNKGTAVDILSVSSRLKDREQLDMIGGAAYLSELVNAVPSSSHAKHYADIVHKLHTRRRLIHAGDSIIRLGFTDDQELDEALDMAEKHVYEVTNMSSNHSINHLKANLDTVLDRLDHLSETDDALRGVPTGFAGLDNMLAGLQKSDLIILAARPSMGKTSLALDIARKAALDHKASTLIFSLEMSSQQLTDRMLAAESRVDSWKLRTGKKLTPEDYEEIRNALERLSLAPIYIDDKPGNNILAMRSAARKLKSEKGLNMIVVDYLQLMVPTQSRNSDNVVQQVTEISRSLKNLARELEVPVLALSQLSRAVEQRGGRPRLSDLRDSGSIEQDADVVMFIHREDKYKDNPERPNIAEILIEKHRNGPTGKVELFFDGAKTSFVSIEKNASGDTFGTFGA